MNNQWKKTAAPAQNCCVYVCRAPETQLRFGEKIALHSGFALQVLRRAYREQLHLDLEELHLRRTENGKLVCDSGFFSISHSGNYVAVAVCDKPVGVDIQRFSGAKIRDVAQKFFTERELRKFFDAANFTDCFYFTWCKKEALWKSLEEQPATIAHVETCNAPFTEKKLVLDNETYYLAVTGEAKLRLK